ncbi:MAG: FAD-binding oxidoreductase [Gammaproteobacteria bacterium]|nr:FAD-binding oxidoreductase [Gammaproteobacteria bacterium]NNM00394.1 FAD-binding oxidoreductase [Gammaproteobacteria bacterium]
MAANPDTLSRFAPLTDIVGAEHVLTEPDELEYYSQDVYRAFETALAVVRPGSVDELAGVVRAARRAGLAIVPRGGGMSYTDGYLHSTDRGITLDLSRLDRIVEIDPDDMIVTVEVGCTWERLNAALAEHNLRTPYWGPLSGLRATVGGALSQNSVFWGAAAAGSAAEAVIGMDVITGTGEVLPTGAHGASRGRPFFRWDGPDLTGLFIGDTGALGIKARATLRLVPRPAVTRGMSFSFESMPGVCAAMSAMAREGITSECYAFDPGLQNQRVLGGDSDLAEDVKTLGRVAREKGIGESLKVAAAGRRFAKQFDWGLHVHVEDRTAAAAEHLEQRVLAIAVKHGGRTMPNSLPTILTAQPFPPPNSMLGPQGERWVPIHGKVAHSQVVTTMNAVDALFADHAADIERLQIRTGYLLCLVGHTSMLIEPVFFWPDAAAAMHHRNVEAAVLEKLPVHAANPEAAALVETLRDAIRAIFLAQGAVHFQLGKYYPYREGRQPAAWQALVELKALFDPDGILNPGQLGLNAPDPEV